MIATASICHPHETKLWSAIAAAVRPRVRPRPSEWACANVRLRSEHTARPGPYDVWWKPWLSAIHDVQYDNPGKIGCVIMKPEQVGFSRAMLNLLGCWAVTDPGPMLYVLQNDDKASEFAADHFHPTIEDCPALKESFDQAAGERRELMTHRPFVGGVLDFVGAGSPNDIISIGRKFIILDEFEAAMATFPRGKGDLFETAMGRMETYRAQGFILAFCHPRFANKDIHKLYQKLSDQRCWTIDCPDRQCAAPVRLERWSMVEIPRVDADSDQLNPDAAQLLCPTCRRPITESERLRAIWPAHAPGREGGTGRFESCLTPEEAARRPLVGLHVHRLADTDARIVERARRYVTLTGLEERLTFFGKGQGEPFEEVEATLDVRAVREVIKPRDGIELPGGVHGVQYVIVGADLGVPRHNPAFYCTAVAFTPAIAYITLVRRVSGFAAWLELLRTYTVRVAGVGEVGVRCGAVDASFETGQVLDACRTTVFSVAGGARIDLVPMKYVLHLNADNPGVLAPIAKRTNPRRPELGPLDYFYLHRHSWVDRVIRRLGEKRVEVLCNVPTEYEAQLTANVLRPKAKQHGMDRDVFEWSLPKGEHDDWLHSFMVSEFAAAMKYRLDTLYAMSGDAVDSGGTPATDEPEWMNQYRSSGRGEFWRQD